MKISRHQAGSSHLVLLLALAVIVVVGVVGYRVANNTDTGSTTDLNPIQATAVPATIKSSADLQKASNALDSTTIDNSVNPNSLDSDINSLL
jgi:hypothetical protein